MNRTERSIEKREYLQDCLPNIIPSDWYEAPHMVQVQHFFTPGNSTLLEMSREQVKHLIIQLSRWLLENPEEDK